MIEWASSPHRMRWTLWAAKESAFKVARQLDAQVWFQPSAFVVRMVDDALAEVTHGTGRFLIWLDGADDWIHAVGTVSGRTARRPDARLDELPARVAGRGSPSDRVRELARNALARVLPAALQELTIVADGGIPRVRRNGRILPVDLSLSHHGRFVACAWVAQPVMLYS